MNKIMKEVKDHAMGLAGGRLSEAEGKVGRSTSDVFKD